MSRACNQPSRLMQRSWKSRFLGKFKGQRRDWKKLMEREYNVLTMRSPAGCKFLHIQVPWGWLMNFLKPFYLMSPNDPNLKSRPSRIAWTTRIRPPFGLVPEFLYFSGYIKTLNAMFIVRTQSFPTPFSNSHLITQFIPRCVFCCRLFFFPKVPQAFFTSDDVFPEACCFRRIDGVCFASHNGSASAWASTSFSTSRSPAAPFQIQISDSRRCLKLNQIMTHWHEVLLAIHKIVFHRYRHLFYFLQVINTMNVSLFLWREVCGYKFWSTF